MDLPEGKKPEENSSGNQINPVPYRKKTSPRKQAKKKLSDEKEREIYHNQLKKQHRYMPVMDHFEELRWGIIRSAIWVVLCAAVSMIFYDQIFKFVINPIGHLIDAADKKNIIVKLMVTRLSDYFVIQLKLSLVAGFLLAIPVIVYEILHFILPAIDKKFRKWSLVVLVISVFLFWGGIFSAWKFMWSTVIQFLVLGWTPPGIETLNGLQMPEVHLTLADYLSFFFGFHMTFGIACQMPIISVLLTLAGVLTAKIYFSQWRVILLGIAIISAVITPPDVMSMLIMMVPLTFLYFISGMFVYIFQKKTKR
jgi:sec-independent protein translocase protein TatC